MSLFVQYSNSLFVRKVLGCWVHLRIKSQVFSLPVRLSVPVLSIDPLSIIYMFLTITFRYKINK